MRNEKEILLKLTELVRRERIMMESGTDIQLAETRGIRKALEWCFRSMKEVKDNE